MTKPKGADRHVGGRKKKAPAANNMASFSEVYQRYLMPGEVPRGGTTANPVALLNPIALQEEERPREVKDDPDAR